MSRHVRTLKIPVHYLTTKRKLCILDRLTARLTYAVRLFCEEAEKAGCVPKTRREIRQFSNLLQRGYASLRSKTLASIPTLNRAGATVDIAQNRR